MLAPGDLLGFFPPLPLIFPLLLTVPALTEGPTPTPPPVFLNRLSLVPPLSGSLLISSLASLASWVLSEARVGVVSHLVCLAELQGEESYVTRL